MSGGAIDDALPGVSVLVPTLNSARTLRASLAAIRGQAYPADRVEIVIADGGSSDATLEIAREYGAAVVANPLVTGEAGKAAALRAARHDVVALIDSDNIVIGADWLRRMVAPFADPNVVASEPLAFVSESGDSIVDRYCAAFGMNDPLCLFVGNYDKACAATGRWTGIEIDVEDRGDYFTFALSRGPLPTVGANGTLYRRDVLARYVGDYLLDIDIPVRIGATENGRRFAKVRTGIRHLFCADVKSFARKQRRRVRDYFAEGKRSGSDRAYPWRSMMIGGVLRFVASTMTVYPLLYQSARAYRATRDGAALFHVPACYITLWVYGSTVLFARGKALSRDGWRQ